MKFRFRLLFFSIALIHFNTYSQAPNQPTNSVPVDMGSANTNSPDLCATVSDPDGGTLQVKYFGRIKTAATSQKFTIVFLPDTQYYTEEPQGTHGGSIAMFNEQTAWIAANRELKNIVYVGQLGDCVENADHLGGADPEIEWKRAQAAMAVIEDPFFTNLPQGIPFGVCVGNHEQSPFGSATGTTIYYNKYFGADHFMGRDYYGGHYGSNNDNHYQVFSASGIDFMVISLEYDLSTGFTAPGGALDWAEDLVINNPGRKIIVMTHYVMGEDAVLGQQGEPIYERLKVYPNFSFLMGGHVSSINGGEARRTDIYQGNRVHSILSDYQGRAGGGNGLLRIYEFDPAQNKVSVSTYSPYDDTYETDASSQFELPFEMLPQVGQINNVPSGTTPCYNWENLQRSVSYEWNMELYDGQNTTVGPVWSFTTPDNSLPVSLLDFFAAIENKKVKLTWSTTTEWENNHFEIERSADGRIFHTIGKMDGHGNSNNLHRYTFYDEQPFAGKIFYRLKQVDINKQFTFSNNRIVLFDDARKAVVYPNPVGTSGTITIYPARATRRPVKVVICDMNGREVYSVIKNTNQNSFQVKHGLLPGMYIMNIVGEHFYTTEKIVVTGE
jgi:hypothetical protein